MPAAAVISAPIVYMKVAAVKKLIVGLLYIDLGNLIQLVRIYSYLIVLIII